MNKEDILIKLEQIQVHLIADEMDGMGWVKLAQNMIFDLIDELKEKNNG